MATRDRGLPVAFTARMQAGDASVSGSRARGACPTCLSLSCDPDGQAAVVPPAVDALRDVIGHLHPRAGVEPHVVYHPVVLEVFPCQKRWTRRV